MSTVVLQPSVAAMPQMSQVDRQIRHDVLAALPANPAEAMTLDELLAVAGWNVNLVKYTMYDFICSGFVKFVESGSGLVMYYKATTHQ